MFVYGYKTKLESDYITKTETIRQLVSIIINNTILKDFLSVITYINNYTYIDIFPFLLFYSATSRRFCSRWII